MATLGAAFGGSYLAMRGGEKKTAQGPPINASSKDEEAFIQYGQELRILPDKLLTLSQGISQECGRRRQESEGIENWTYNYDYRNAPLEDESPPYIESFAISQRPDYDFQKHVLSSRAYPTSIPSRDSPHICCCALGTFVASMCFYPTPRPGESSIGRTLHHPIIAVTTRNSQLTLLPSPRLLASLSSPET